MGTHAERVAISDHVGRADQDAFALAPTQGDRRQDAGRFAAEMASVTVRDPKGGNVVTSTRDPAAIRP